MAISVNKVTRMGLAGAMWRPQGSYANKVEGVAPENKAVMLFIVNTNRMGLR